MVKHRYLNFTESTYSYGKVVGTSKDDVSSNGLTNKAITVVQIPPTFDDDCVVEIGWYSFRWTSITSIFIPKTVLRISWGAFEGCSSLTEVRFEAGSRLERISGAAFNGCKQLKKIDFPSSVKEIGYGGWKVFNGIDLECFSYQGASNFSSVDMFKSVSVIHVLSDYQFEQLGNFCVNQDNATCNVSHERFYPKRRLCNSPNIRYQCRGNNFLLITIFLSR